MLIFKCSASLDSQGNVINCTKYYIQCISKVNCLIAVQGRKINVQMEPMLGDIIVTTDNEVLSSRAVR